MADKYHSDDRSRIFTIQISGAGSKSGDTTSDGPLADVATWDRAYARWGHLLSDYTLKRARLLARWSLQVVPAGGSQARFALKKRNGAGAGEFVLYGDTRTAQGSYEEDIEVPLETFDDIRGFMAVVQARSIVSGQTTSVYEFQADLIVEVV
mgnify:CR=1 FL=1